MGRNYYLLVLTGFNGQIILYIFGEHIVNKPETVIIREFSKYKTNE